MKYQKISWVLSVGDKCERKISRGQSRIYNKNIAEVCVLINEEQGKRGIILQLRDGGIKEIDDTHCSSDSLHFVMVPPSGHDGWHVQLKQVNPDTLDQEGNQTLTNNRLTVREFYALHLHRRAHFETSLFRICHLFQEYLYVQCAKYENPKLFWIKTNQHKIREDLHNSVVDAIHANDLKRPILIGRYIIYHHHSTGGQEICIVGFKMEWQSSVTSTSQIFSLLLTAIQIGKKFQKLY